MRKEECEAVIRSLCHQWRKESGQSETDASLLSFQDFIAWVRKNGPIYLDFRTSTSVTYDVEMWFDNEFKQSGRR